MLANWEVFKIIEKKHWKQNPEYIYFDLDRYFRFANRISNQIWCSNQEPFKNWKVGDVIRIDINWLMWHDPAQNDCTIRSIEVAQLADETELSRTQVENSFTGSSSRPQLPPVWAVETGNYRWGSENTDLVLNEEFQTTIQQQHFPLKKN